MIVNVAGLRGFCPPSARTPTHAHPRPLPSPTFSLSRPLASPRISSFSLDRQPSLGGGSSSSSSGGSGAHNRDLPSSLPSPFLSSSLSAMASAALSSLSSVSTEPLLSAFPPLSPPTRGHAFAMPPLGTCFPPFSSSFSFLLHACNQLGLVLIYAQMRPNSTLHLIYRHQHYQHYIEHHQQRRVKHYLQLMDLPVLPRSHYPIHRSHHLRVCQRVCLHHLDHHYLLHDNHRRRLRHQCHHQRRVHQHHHRQHRWVHYHHFNYHLHHCLVYQPMVTLPVAQVDPLVPQQAVMTITITIMVTSPQHQLITVIVKW
jgi:hypothetical protein